MPKHSGKAIRKTRKPDGKSLRQFSFKPAKPDFGNPSRDDSLIHTNPRNYKNRLKDHKRLLCQVTCFCKQLVLVVIFYRQTKNKDSEGAKQPVGCCFALIPEKQAGIFNASI
jgi:hypothetical protein